MRARLVEDINFERGLDPKDSMRLGKKWKWEMTAIELAMEIIDSVGETCRPINGKILKAVQNAGYKDVESYLEYVAEYYNENNKDPFISKELDNALEELEKTISVEIEKYPIKESEKERLAGTLYTLYLEGGPYMTYADMVASYLDPTYLLKESINFERGQDPKKSLGVGQKAMKKKLIEILPDLSKNLLWDEMYKNIITGINLSDTIVTIDDNYIIVKTPRLTWRFADNLRLMLNMSKKIPSHEVELEKKPSRKYIYLRDSDWMKNYKTPRVYKYRIL